MFSCTSASTRHKLVSAVAPLAPSLAQCPLRSLHWSINISAHKRWPDPSRSLQPPRSPSGGSSWTLPRGTSMHHSQNGPFYFHTRPLLAQPRLPSPTHQGTGLALWPWRLLGSPCPFSRSDAEDGGSVTQSLTSCLCSGSSLSSLPCFARASFKKALVPAPGPGESAHSSGLPPPPALAPVAAPHSHHLPRKAEGARGRH